MDFADDLAFFSSSAILGSRCTKRHIQEKPTNCGTKAADVLANFEQANFNVNPLKSLVHLQLL